MNERKNSVGNFTAWSMWETSRRPQPLRQLKVKEEQRRHCHNHQKLRLLSIRRPPTPGGPFNNSVPIGYTLGAISCLLHYWKWNGIGSANTN